MATPPVTGGGFDVGWRTLPMMGAETSKKKRNVAEHFWIVGMQFSVSPRVGRNGHNITETESSPGNQKGLVDPKSDEVMCNLALSQPPWPED